MCASPQSTYDQLLDFGMALRRRSFGTLRGAESAWRRERDSNPRYRFRYTHFPGACLKPLGHLSAKGANSTGGRPEAKRRLALVGPQA
jgi:hypothetical protein